MSIPQKKLREIVFQLLYSFDMGFADERDLIELIMKELAVTKSVVRQALEKVRNIQNKQKDIDNAIGKTSQSYSFERIQSVERNILRIGFYEILFDESIPPKVSIAEAMRLARKFGTPESASFVNAVLDHLYKLQLGENTDPNVMLECLEELEKKESISQEGHDIREKENSK